MFSKLIKLSIIAIMLFGVYHYSDASFTISRPPTNNLGLVGHWTFDGKNVVNGVALDSSGNGNNGNLINIATSTFYSYGKIGQGFNFDGVDDYVNIGNKEIIDSETAASICFWMKYNPSSVTEDGAIVSKWTTSGGWVIWVDDVDILGSGKTDTISFAVDVGPGAPGRVVGTTGLVTSGVWDYYCGTFQGGSFIRLYKNGVLNAENTTSIVAVVANNSQPIYFANSADTSLIKYLNASIDEVRVYSRVLSAGEIKNLYNQGASKINKTPTNILTNGLVGHWTFDGKNVVNGVALDSSGNGNNGNLINIATSTFYSYGKIGQGFNFDGTNDYINLGNNVSLAPSGAITIVGWINSLNPLGLSEVMFDKTSGSAVNGNYFCRIQGVTGKVRFEINTGAATTLNANTVLSANVWYHIACVWDGANMYIYLNGASDATPAVKTGTMADNGLNASIGRKGGNTLFFNGKLDEVRLYNRTLSAGEIKMLYNMGR